MRGDGWRLSSNASYPTPSLYPPLMCSPQPLAVTNSRKRNPAARPARRDETLAALCTSVFAPALGGNASAATPSVRHSQTHAALFDKITYPCVTPLSLFRYRCRMAVSTFSGRSPATHLRNHTGPLD